MSTSIQEATMTRDQQVGHVVDALRHFGGDNLSRDDAARLLHIWLKGNRWFLDVANDHLVLAAFDPEPWPRRIHHDQTRVAVAGNRGPWL
jgi:hypothetical protein